MSHGPFSQTHVADVTQNIIRSELQGGDVVLADRMHVPPVGIFAAMENLGLENFR